MKKKKEQGREAQGTERPRRWKENEGDDEGDAEAAADDDRQAWWPQETRLVDVGQVRRAGLSFLGRDGIQKTLQRVFAVSSQHRHEIRKPKAFTQASPAEEVGCQMKL